MDLFKLFGTIEIDNSKANKSLDETSEKGGNAESKLSKAFSKVGSAAVAVGKTVAVGMVAAGTAVAGLVTKSVQSYADYEQLVGGVDTLFKDSSNKVQEYAKNAYKTAGMSANDYMETVTGFSAALLQSLGGDTEKAAEKANLALTDMSDNANKMGTDMEMIKTAYAGFSKQNYTMLDNLKLGYGGTKTEMERLLKDAEKFSGIKYDISSYADVVDAIQVIQTEMGITGTTAKEASSTISGSISSMKSSWQNLLTAISADDLDFNEYVSAFVDSVSTVADNLLPRIEIALDGVVQLVSQLAPKIVSAIPGLVSTLLPAVVSAATSLIEAIATALPGVVTAIVACIPDIISAFVSIFNAIVAALPSLMESIVSALPILIPALINGLVNMIVTLCTMLPQIIQPIIDYLPEIIVSVVNALLQNLPALIQGVGQLIVGLAQALPQLCVAIWEAIKGVFASLGSMIGGFFEPVKNAISNAWQAMGNVPGLSSMKTMIEQVWGAIKSHITVVINAIKNVVSTYWNAIKNVVGTVITAIKSVISSAWNTIKTIISNVMKIISSVLKGDWEGVKTAISNIIDAIKSYISTVWNAIKSVISSVMKGIKSVVSSIWNGIKSVISSAINSIKTVITSVWNGIKSTTSSVFNGIKSTASSAWNDIKNKMTQPIEKARDTIKGIVDKITGFFNNMKISIPNIKLPHISISGKLSLNPPSVPKLSISWYKKAMDNPMIMNEPTIFGFNPATGSFMGGGEAGSEVVSGTNTLMNMISSAVAGQNEAIAYYLQKLIEMLADYFPQILEGMDTPRQAVFDPNQAAAALAVPMNYQLGRLSTQKGRGR